MTHAFIEHVTLSVSDAERSAALMIALFGWHERWRGPAPDGGLTIHVGSERSYFSFHSVPGSQGISRDQRGQPLYHIGIEVDDLDDAEQRVVDVGLTPFDHQDYDPGRRFYFLDPDGIEYEVVSYSDPARG